MENTSLSETPARALTSAERRFVARAGRFLTQITSPSMVQRALAAGYDDAEHAEGWRLHRIAGGGARPLGHAFAFRDLTRSGQASEAEALLARLDDIENHWFPVVRRVILRHVPKPHTARFEAAFFEGLAQQPKGPAVIGSVEKLLGRIDDLKDSAEPGAATVYATLVKRGIEDVKRSAQVMIGELREFALPEPVVDVQAVELTLRAQREAFEGLRLWFNDWRATLSATFSLRERISLGLSRLRRSSQGAEEETFAEEEEEEAIEEEVSAQPAA